MSSKSGKLTSNLVDRWFVGTLADAIEASEDHHVHDADHPSVILLADSWSGHTKNSQERDLRSLGAKLL